jgi:PAS domain S-box-containing protein
MAGFQFYPPLILILLATLVGVLTTLYAVYYLNKYERTKQVVTFTVLAATITIWTLFALLQVTATSYDQSYWAYKMLHFGSFTTAPAVLFYGLSMGDARRWVNWKTVSVVSLLILPVFVLLFTEPVPVLFEDPHLVSFGAFSVIAHGNSPIYVSYLSAFYLIATIGLSYIVYQTWFDPSLSRRQTAILVPAIFAPMLLSVAQTFSLLPFETPGTILTPTSFSVGMAGVGYAAFRYETFDTKVLARSRAIENMNDGYLLIDTGGEIIDANQRAQSLLAVDNSLTGMGITELFPNIDDQMLKRPETVPQFETQFETETGTRTLEVSPSNFVTKTEQTLGTLLVVRDITTRKRAQEQLEEQRNNLEVLNQVVRHDIRNDMTVILSRSELLEDHIDHAGKEHLESVMDATTGAIELTQTARDLAETMLSSAEDVEPVRLDAHLRKPIENARSEFQESVVTAGEIPNVRVRGNELLEAVFRNLLRNAIIHNDKQQPEVQVSTTVDEEMVTVAIADNGPGIPDNQTETVFGKGEKGLDSPGTGIGLYLVQTLLDQYGGDVWVEDNEPEGSVFVVELPVAE